jgi:hypothetical protein
MNTDKTNSRLFCFLSALIRRNHGPRFFLAAKALGVNLVDIFGAGWTGGEPMNADQTEFEAFCFLSALIRVYLRPAMFCSESSRPTVVAPKTADTIDCASSWIFFK